MIGGRLARLDESVRDTHGGSGSEIGREMRDIEGEGRRLSERRDG